MPPSAGLRAHVELARISGYIVCEIFEIAPRHRGSGYTISNIDKVLTMLEAWQSMLPSTLQPTFDWSRAGPASYNLHMAKNQLIILTTRPIFLAAVKQAVAARYHQGYWSVDQHPQAMHIRACSKTAYRNVVMGRNLNNIMRSVQAGLHFIFNATVILLLNRIVISIPKRQDYSVGTRSTSSEPDDHDHTSEIAIAIEIFEYESKAAGTHYPKDCYRVLLDLKALVDRYLSQPAGRPLPQNNTGSVRGAATLHNSTERYPQPEPDQHEDHSMSREMTTWKQGDGLELHSISLI